MKQIGRLKSRMLFRAIPQLVLGVAIAFSGIASAQTQSQDQDPSQPAQPGVAEASSPQPDVPRVEPTVGGGIRLPLTHIPEVFGTSDVRKRFGSISPDAGTWGISGDSSGNSRFGPVNPNAPWKASGGLTYSSNNGTVAKIGFIGYANYRIPPVMTQMIGSGQDLALPLFSFTDLSQAEVQWMLTARVEKTFIRIPGGTTIGGVADVFVPLNNAASSIIVPGTRVPRSITYRGGVKLGF